MNFELGKRYIVNVTEKGIVPTMEFDRDRWFNKDHDDLDFLTIEDWQTDIHDNECDAKDHDFVFERIFEIIDEHKAPTENGTEGNGLRFSERNELSMAYNRWLFETNKARKNEFELKDNAFQVITFLDSKGLLRDEEIKAFVKPTMRKETE